MQTQLTTASRLQRLMSSKPDETQHGIALLVTLAWEDERTDLHGVGCAEYGHNSHGRYVTLTCYCGADPVTGTSEDEALTLLEDHARTTCAACHGPKVADTFPRCSTCAF